MSASGTADLDAAIRDFGEAWARGDLAVLSALLSPSYTHNDASGEHLKRDDWLAYAALRTGRSTAITFRGVETRRFGDVAIVTGFNDIAGAVRGPGDAEAMSIAFTQVWRLDGGRWLREAFQATPVVAEGFA